MKDIRKIIWVLYLLGVGAAGHTAGEEPKFWLQDNIARADDVVRGWFDGCTLWLRVSHQADGSDAFKVEIPLEKIDPYSIRVHEDRDVQLVTKGGTEAIREHYGRRVLNEASFRIGVGDAELAAGLAENLSGMTRICNLYDCPDGRLCQENRESTPSAAGEETAEESTPELTREEIETALGHAAEFAEHVLTRNFGIERSEETKKIIRAIPAMTSEELEDLRASSGLPRYSEMTAAELAFNRAVIGARYGKMEPILRFLDDGGDVNHRADRREYRLEGTTLLMSAISGNFPEIVASLIARGADVDLAGYNDRRPVIAAADDAHLECLKLLLKDGAELGRAVHGSTPLWHATASEDMKTIKLLLGHGADPNEPGSYDEPPLSRASLSGYPEVTRMLLQTGAEVDATDRDGTTALMVADNKSVARILVKEGRAELNLQDDEGKTALDHAKDNRNYEVVNYLTDRGALSSGDLLRHKWVASRPPSQPTGRSPTAPRSPCGQDTSKLTPAEIWNDPEYEIFRSRLADLIPPLTPAEEDLTAAALLEAGWGSVESLFLSFLPALMQVKGDVTQLDGDLMEDAALAEGADTMRRIGGNVLLRRDRFTQLSPDALFEAGAMLGFSLMLTYGNQGADVTSERRHEIYDLMYTAFDLPQTLLPCPSLSAENQVLANMLMPLLQSIAPVREKLPQKYPELTNADVAWLRSRLDPWPNLRNLDSAFYEDLAGGLPGHAPISAAARFLGVNDDRIPYLLFFYRPDEYRDRPFRCTDFERAIVEEMSFLPQPDPGCTPRKVEFGLLALLLNGASESGEELDQKRRYEYMYLALFLTRHYGDVFEQARPGFHTTMRQVATDFIRAIDLIDRPDTDLNPMEMMFKEKKLQTIRNPVRARQLYDDLKQFLE